jgi:integrase
MHVEQEEREHPIKKDEDKGSTTYSLFVYAVRSQITRDYYLRRLRIFFNHINLFSERTMEERCNIFAAKGLKDPNWAFISIVKFLQFQRQRVEKEGNYRSNTSQLCKSHKAILRNVCIPVAWKKISRGLPKIRRYAADDRAPTVEEIQKICEYSDRRIKAIVYTMSSSGIRLGACDYLRWRHIEPIRRGFNET